MISFEIRIMGRVQGVGFRPFVYRKAIEYSIKGCVLNGNSGVHIKGSGLQRNIKKFYRNLIEECPAAAVITDHHIKWSAYFPYSDFTIISSTDIDESTVLVSPDFALCSACEKELNDLDNRRYQYAFTTCTNCGPRYSILTDIPYDRPYTTMEDFPMCPACVSEYLDPLDRRYYSQTNSCPICGPTLNLTPASLEKEDIMVSVLRWLNEGKILAVKGIGGYLLMADATNPGVIRELRRRKRRPSKPFALLYPDLPAIQADCQVGAQEEIILQSLAAPICLLQVKSKPESELSLNEIAPGLNKLGIMLPYAPLLSIISRAYGKPLIATSANLSGSPIIYNNEDAEIHLAEIADSILHHNRKIIIAQDDSVIQLSPLHKTKIIFRRSRGMAPNFFSDSLPDNYSSILSTGADLKGSIALVHNSQIFISQYLGELNNLLSQESLEKTLAYWQKLYDFKPSLILSDLHPGYHSSIIGKHLASAWHIEQKLIPHHHAHFSAILGEHQLWNSPDPILGCIWDGTGHGLDGQNWGGEFFTYRKKFDRNFHLEYLPMLSGDLMAKEPRVMGLLFSELLKITIPGLYTQFTDIEKKILRTRMNNCSVQSSSMGRLFDGVAAILGICYRNNHEGEAALKLQTLAEEYAFSHDYPLVEYYPILIINNIIEIKPLLSAIVADVLQSEDKSKIAYKFHLTCVKMMEKVAMELDIDSIAFSGGVFQNALLVDLVQKVMVDSRLYFHKQLSPNDENISYGQIQYFLNIDNQK